MQFYRLAIGARFEFHGRQYTKEAMSVAGDDTGQGNVFHGGTEVAPIGEPRLLPDAEAQKWTPFDLEHWADHLPPAPGR